MSRWHAPVGEHEIGEAKQREELSLVLRQPAVAGLAMPEEVLDNMKGMLHLRPDARLELFEPILQPAQFICRQGLAHAALHRHQPFDGLALVLGTFLNALVTPIAKHGAFLAVQRRTGVLADRADQSLSGEASLDELKGEIRPLRPKLAFGAEAASKSSGRDGKIDHQRRFEWAGLGVSAQNVN